MPGGGCGMPGGGPPPPAGASFCAGLNGSCSEYTLFVVSLARVRDAVRTAPNGYAHRAAPFFERRCPVFLLTAIVRRGPILEGN